MARTRQQRALDRLNVAIAGVSASTQMIETSTSAEMVTKLREQIEHQVDEAYAAISDIRHALELIA
jgi:hypothetical protein